MVILCDVDQLMSDTGLKDVQEPRSVMLEQDVWSSQKLKGTRVHLLASRDLSE